MPPWLHAERKTFYRESEQRILDKRMRHGYARAEFMLQVAFVESGTAMEVVEQSAARFGLELVVPFMDRRIMDLAFSVPADLLAGDIPKGLLRDALRGHLPDSVLDSCRKITQDAAIARDVRVLSWLEATKEWWLIENKVIDAGWLARHQKAVLTSGRVDGFMHRLLIAEHLARKWS